MQRIEQRVQVVLVSPGDVADERAVAQAVVDELNRAVAGDRGCRLSLWRWETDARSGLHLEGPQGLIDELMEIQDADIVVGVFWRRFGTPTGEAASGTQHELRRAWAAWQEQGRPEVMLYFCTRAYSPRATDELAQWQRVFEFKDELPKEQLWREYETVAQFEKLLREHLTQYVLSRVAQPASEPGRTTGPRVRFNLPAVAAAFTGRDEELAALDDALGVTDRAVITQAIGGLGGVGKSQLAARYVQQRADTYDVLAWIGAEDGGIAELGKLAATLGVQIEGLSLGDRAQLALERLSEGEQRWLLVLDNIESAEQLVGLRPRGGNGRVLVTSRDRSLRQFGPVLTIDVFDEDTATTYLTDRAGRPADWAAARELARALGCLPLALSHSGAYCQSGTSFTEYHELLNALPARELFDSNPELSYAQTVASTWRASIDAAGAAAPLAADALELAAHLAPDAIPKSLFGVLVDADTARGRKRLTGALNALARFSLATVDDDTVGVHRLLQKVVRDDSAARDDQTGALRALAAVADVFPSDVRPPACWPLCERLLPHALALPDTLPQAGDSASQLIDLLNRACWYLKRAEPGRRGLPIAQRVLNYAERLLSAEHVATLTARGNLAAAYRATGRNGKAIAILEPLLADCERILGAPHPQTLETRHNLVSANRAGGRSGEAIAVCEPLLADCERILGPEHPETLRARNSLAGAYREAGRSGEALAICEPLLADRERILGADHPDTLRTRNNLALAYQQAGRCGEAIAVYEPLVADRARILGAEHPDTLMTRNHLVGAYQEAGRSGEAIAVCEPLIATHERILGLEHPRTLTTRGNLATAYRNAGRVAEAIAIYEPLLAACERTAGPEHPHTLSTRNNLAIAYQEAERGDEAIAIYEPLLADRERILGPEHPHTLNTRNNLGTAYHQAGRSDEAIAIYELLLADRERILGPEHPHTLNTRNKLANAYQQAGRSAQAEAAGIQKPPGSAQP